MPSFLSFFLFFGFFFDNCFLELEVVDPTILVAPPHCFFRLFFSFSFLFFFLGLYNHSYNNWQRTILIDNQTKLLAATKHFCFLLFRFHNIDPGAEGSLSKKLRSSTKIFYPMPRGCVSTRSRRMRLRTIGPYYHIHSIVLAGVCKSPPLIPAINSVTALRLSMYVSSKPPHPCILPQTANLIDFHDSSLVNRWRDATDT